MVLHNFSLYLQSPFLYWNRLLFVPLSLGITVHCWVTWSHLNFFGILALFGAQTSLCLVDEQFLFFSSFHCVTKCPEDRSLISSRLSSSSFQCLNICWVHCHAEIVRIKVIFLSFYGTRTQKCSLILCKG